MLASGQENIEHNVLIFFIISMVFLWSTIFIAKDYKIKPSKKFWIITGSITFIIVLLPIWLFSGLATSSKLIGSFLSVAAGLTCIAGIYFSAGKLRDLLVKKK